MGLRGKFGAKGGSRLFVAYAAASLVPVGVLGAVLVTGYREDAARQAEEQGRAQAVVIAEMAVAPALEEADLTAGLTETQRDRLHAATDFAIFHGSVVRLRLRSFSGQVVFSDDGSTAGGIPVADPAFRTAAVGQTDVAVVPDLERSPGQVIRVLEPVVASTSGRAIGVLELYLPYESIAAQLQQQMRVTYWRLAAGLVGLYLVLALISWSTTRSLRRYAAQQEREALHDALTGLPNRAAFRLRARAALENAPRRGAFVLVDLNHFKEVNDTLGHHAGDELLKVVAARLVEALRPEDTVTRLGGDEFGLILPGVDRAEVVALLSGARSRLTEEIVLDGIPLTIEASFGVALYPEHGAEVEELLQCADAAMYQGKRGTNGIVVYAGGEVAHSTQWLVVQAELRHAFERDELVLHYQPKIRLSDGEICGVEALVRWQHPTRGLLAPAEFLPAAEQSGLIEPLTDWVLRRALADQRDWLTAGRSWPVSVNVSARNLDQPGFAASVAALVTRTGTPADMLMLEVTETALAGDAPAAIRAVVDIVERGIGVAVDDFGVGYTSLSQLRAIPVSEIKIDRLFVDGLSRNPQSEAIVRSVIELAHGLGCWVTAEGVENEEVRRWLSDAGCDAAQGTLLGTPLTWNDLIETTAAGRTRREIPAPAGS
ncbi:putative bifunctional diguanylate cyclase/phosphodiesterase [Couchioplanes caeruleus]|uniref:Diguanylate cyclase (GGDEF)-like protein n=1 Tax=Couchioplanes caeruleus TaxID=56438 RepID=A0A3N1GCA3_9ACTN|nr:bifunctional diguanylate cyclase/phosphodiesterase [Couchioplanes caeruleus]ROP27902.1 diguanylate cyclase (GGDEF)-like protein [Couchioplanes caeruleus]